MSSTAAAPIQRASKTQATANIPLEGVAASPRPVARRLDPAKFREAHRTAKGEPRAAVDIKRLDTLWINTGTLCNLTCVNCYIESSPRNDRLSYIAADEVAAYLDELDRDWQTREVGFTGGEPFMNPHIIPILEDTLSRGYRALVLTNAMKPMKHKRQALLTLRRRYGARLAIRVSVDHHDPAKHEEERGEGSWAPMIEGLVWLSQEGFQPSVAGRTYWDESEADLRAGYARLFAEQGIAIDCADPEALVLFPEMDEREDVPEVSEGCWNILGVSPDAMMCASQRMVIKRRGAERPSVVACTLLPYDPQFELGHTLAEARRRVYLNHPHCAKFCVLGGGSCSKTE